MDTNDSSPSVDNSVPAEPVVPPKQVHRWKDDGGAIAPEPQEQPDDAD